MQKKENKKKKYDMITTSFLVILTITMLYDYFLGNGDKLYRLILTILTMLIARFILGKMFLKQSKFIYYCTLIFIFVSMYCGNILNAYIIIPFYDKVLHLISGILIGFIGFIIFVYFNKDNMKNINKSFLLIFIISFSVALAGIWEIWEFTTDFLFGFNSQNASLVDTMMDIICGTIGGIISLIPIISYIKNEKNKFVELMLKDITQQ